MVDSRSSRARAGAFPTQAGADAVAEGVAAVVSRVFGDRNGVQGRRRSPSAERLSADRIVEVAIEQMREHGYDAVTMRSIARELGTGPASLYAHVANRAELDQLVVGKVSSQLRIPDPDPAVWDEQLRACLVDLLELYRANPGVARCTMGMIPLDAGALMVSERWIALLKAGGVSDQHVAWFIDMSSLYVAAVAMEEDMWRMPGSAEPSDQAEDAVVANVRSVFEQLPAEHFPLLRALAPTMTTGSADERFGFGVDLLIGGLKALSR
ncbi:MAG TPA: TetR/AcrR family transcriptional regulator [Marmoricola sp.]|nr:TetR/AcrR family transcriptional regulator [Marmoricola sp.]